MTLMNLNLDRAVRVVRKHVLTVCRPDSCIASTRAMIEVLAYFGLDARPQPVHVKVFSPLTADLMTRRVPMPEWPAEARYVHLGDTGLVRPNRWDGHLVAILEPPGQSGVLLDPSIDQAARPERNILVGPLAISMTDTGLPVLATLPSGTNLLYTVLDNEDYRRSPNWRSPSMLRPAIAGAIRELKELFDDVHAAS